MTTETEASKLSPGQLNPDFRLWAAFEIAIFVADRWGAVFSTRIIESDHDLPAEAEIRDWLEFIELQCEKCFPSEWPL